MLASKEDVWITTSWPHGCRAVAAKPMTTSARDFRCAGPRRTEVEPSEWRENTGCWERHGWSARNVARKAPC